MKIAPSVKVIGCGPGFNGEPHERVTGWQILGNGYRVYNPVLMRFHSPDNQSPFGKGGLNAYMYCGADPVNQIDPTGHGFVSGFLRFIKARPTVTTHSAQAADLPQLFLFKPSYIKQARLKKLTDVDAGDVKLIRNALDDSAIDDVIDQFVNGGQSTVSRPRRLYREADEFASNNIGNPVITKYARRAIARKAAEVRAQLLRSVEGADNGVENLQTAINRQRIRQENLYQ